MECLYPSIYSGPEGYKVGGEDKSVKEELRAWEGRGHPGRGTEGLEGGLQVGVGVGSFVTLSQHLQNHLRGSQM